MFDGIIYPLLSIAHCEFDPGERLWGFVPVCLVKVLGGSVDQIRHLLIRADVIHQTGAVRLKLLH